MTGTRRDELAAGSQAALTRRFVDVGSRRVHCRMMGSGPPALFVHSSPANSSFVVSEMAVVADRYTCFAFDTPGFGLSEPLPGAALAVSDLADALAETLTSIGMPPVPVFGTHTGAAIALELASRHPEMVTGLVLDGLPDFSRTEYQALFADYTPDWPIDPLGGHFARTWTRFRDQSTWFPWTARDHRAANASDLSPPASTDTWVTMFFDCADTYKTAYRAALSYLDAVPRLDKLGVPVILTAVSSDMLYPHLDRFATVVVPEAIRRVGASYDARRGLTAEGFARFGSVGVAPIVPVKAAASSRVVRQFIDVPGGQLMMRSVGDPAHPAVVVVHDLPGSGTMAEARMTAMADAHFVVAFDLPGCDESGAPGGDVAALAATLAAACLDAGIKPHAAWGIGFGSSVAVELAKLNHLPLLVLEGLLLSDAAERAALKADFAPPIHVDADGGHWYRTWLMLRDSETWWPWFDRRQAALRRVPADYDARRLHDRTRAVLRQPERYAEALAAILDHDAEGALACFRGRILVVRDSLVPLATAYADRLAALPRVELVALDDLGALP